MISRNPKIRQVWSLFKYVSEMKPPRIVSKNVEPKKLVRVLAAEERSKKRWK